MDIHFANAKWNQVSEWLDQRIHPSVNRRWCFPPSDYLVLIYNFHKPEDDFDLEEFDALCRQLGDSPTCSLILELRRSKGQAAVDAARNLIKELLRAFKGVAHDDRGECIVPA